MRAARPAFAVILLAGAAVPAASETLTFFRTPSGNIHCLAVQDAAGASVACELRDRDDPEPLRPRPADCGLDWGDAFVLAETGPGEMACHGDTVQNPEGVVLPYGSSLGLGAIACLSTREGLECFNPGGHGFFLSRGLQRVF